MRRGPISKIYEKRETKMNNFRATVIPDNPYRKMIIGRIAAALVVAILSTISAFMVLSASSGVARAGRDFCPDGHTCYWAEQRQTERRACHVQHATAVTTSIKKPLLDFRSNLEGGFMLLEPTAVLPT